jgi:uncharacterized membrane protein YhdT
VKLARWAPISGVLYVVLWVITIFGFDSDTGDSDADIVSWYADSGNRDKQLIGFFLVLAASLCFIWFLSVLRGRLAQAEGTAGTKTALAFGAGLVAVTLWTIAMAVWMAISFTVGDSDEFVVDPNMDRLFGNFGYALWFAGTTIALLVVLCTALVGLKGGVIPRWLAWVSVLVAITMLASFAFLPFLIWLGWVLVVSLIWLFAKPEADAASAATPRG